MTTSLANPIPGPHSWPAPWHDRIKTARLVLADVADPAAIDQLCARWKLRVVRRVSPGVALLERE